MQAVSEYIVEMKHITKRFPGITANDDVTLQIKKGEIFALLGENGAGKSTIMSVLFGMYEPDEGEIYVRGKKERIISPNYAAGLNIGMVFQHFNLISNYTITENIIMGIEPKKKFLGFIPYVDVKSADKKIRELSESYGLTVDPTLKIEDLTVSIQQRVEILKMLYREAEILIFDEPTAVLTPQEIEALLEILLSLKAAGKTIILITHKLAEIKKVADRCAVLRKGKLIDVLDVKTTSMEQMANLMVGRDVNFGLDKSTADFGEEILSVKDLVVKNEMGFPVVNDTSFSVRRGEVFGIAGVSGNGQIELADAIAGLMKVSGGSILFKGKDISRESIRARTEAGIAYIPEDRHKYGLVLDFSLQENLILKKYYQKPYASGGIRNDAEAASFGQRLIDEYDIRSSQGLPTIVRTMSGGNQQKAIIAREVEQDADLVIYVQPTRGLDIGAIENIRKDILAERDKGRAILLVSLELDEIMALSDTIGVIFDGKLTHIAPAEDLNESIIGEYMMGVRK